MPKLSKTLAIIQARMSSNRRPGKVLAELSGLPAIVFMVRRLSTTRTLDQIVVATSNSSSDDPLVDVLNSEKIANFRGDLNDVLLRYTACAEFYNATDIVRLTGDCPLIDPFVVDRVVDIHKIGYTYTSNTMPRTFPDGLDTEIFTIAALHAANNLAVSPDDREHVTPWMRRNTDKPNIGNFAEMADLSHIRWTVDYESDLETVRRLIGAVDDPILADRFDFLRAMSTLSIL